MSSYLRAASPNYAASDYSTTSSTASSSSSSRRRVTNLQSILPSLNVAILVLILLRVALSLSPHSGQGTISRGDFEAQRNWVSISNLPVSRWYFASEEWWKLDYPPLSIFHALLIRWVAKVWAPEEWFAFPGSRGQESEGLKVFMRWAVVASDAILALAALYFVGSKRRRSDQTVAFLVIMSQPALLLIDHCHFQFNSVSLGLALLCFGNLIPNPVLACVPFVCALCFKQMSLFYAPAVGIWLVGTALSEFGWRRKLAMMSQLAFVTLCSFGVILLPFLPSGLQGLQQMRMRVFPVARGIFEDKVSNAWCFLDILLHIRRRVSESNFQLLSALLVLVSIAPMCVFVLRYSIVTMRKSQTILLLALLHTSMACYLFGYQVHEKSILLPLLPCALLMASSGPGKRRILEPDWEFGVWFQNMALFSIWPLLRKEGCALQYLTILVAWNFLFARISLSKPTSLMRYVSAVSYTVMATIHALELSVSPTERYPDIYPVLNVLLCTPCFGFVFLWSGWRVVEESWTIISEEHTLKLRKSD